MTKVELSAVSLVAWLVVRKVFLWAVCSVDVRVARRAGRSVVLSVGRSVDLRAVKVVRWVARKAGS